MKMNFFFNFFGTAVSLAAVCIVEKIVLMNNGNDFSLFFFFFLLVHPSSLYPTSNIEFFLFILFSSHKGSGW